MNFSDVYWLGGSPCCGKSTVAGLLARRMGFRLYECDEHLEAYTLRGARQGSALMQRYLDKSADATWLRPVDRLTADEFAFYREAADFLAEDIAAFPPGSPLLVEGAAVTPEFAARFSLPLNRYFCMAPTPEFQVAEYEKRQWAKDYMATSSQPEQAFSNWMQRDIRFAEAVLRQAAALGYPVLLTDGSLSVEEVYQTVLQAFGLAGP